MSGVGSAVSAADVQASLGVRKSNGRAVRTRRGTDSPLYALREAAGYSRVRLAGLSGISERQVARIEEGALAPITVEQLVRLAIVMGCTVLDIVPAMGQRLTAEQIPGREREMVKSRLLWKRRLPAPAAAEKRETLRRLAVEWLWSRVVAGGGKVRSDHVKAEYRDEGEPWGRAHEVLFRARCELGMYLLHKPGEFGWWWVSDHRPLVVGELPPILKISDRVGRRELSSEG